MRISELSARSGVSVASIKYYLREGLLTSGTPTAVNQATYSDNHLRRLRLIRSLLDIGGLSVSQIRSTLSVVDNESTPIHDAFGAVMHRLSDTDPMAEPDEVATALTEVQEWMATMGWHVDSNAPAPQRLAELVATSRRFGLPLALSYFDTAAHAFEHAADIEVAYAREMPSRTAAVETMLIGTVVIEQALVQVRRLALEAASFRIEAANDKGQ